jgi:hypothetical protein
VVLGGLSRDEHLAQIEDIAWRLRQSEERKPQALYGIWKGKLLENDDVDSKLEENQQKWKECFGEFHR